MKKIKPFIWFKKDAKEALDFYTAVFPDSRVVMSTAVEGAPGPAHQMVATFELMGEPFMCLEGGENPMLASSGPISLVAECETQAEIDKLWDAFAEGGKPIACGWITDKYGVTWQVVPTILGKLMTDPDKEKVQRVTQAFMKMVKFDIAALEAAAA